MKCAQVERRVERFVDGAVEAAQARRIDSHLQSCARCRARVDAARALVNGLDVPAERAPAGFAARVMDAVYQEALRQSRRTSAAGPQSRRIYRRLGLSFLLTAGVLAVSLFVPHAAYNGLFGTGSAAVALSRESDISAQRGFGAAVQNVMGGADSVVRGILREQANGGNVR